MRILASFLLINVLAFAQNLTELGAVAAGSAAGGAGGKSVSNGISAIFGKVDQQTAKAAVKEAVKETKSEKEPQIEALKVAPGAVGDPGAVPLPSPPARKRVAPAPLPVAQFVVPEEVTRLSTLADVAPVLPPPPVMSPKEFRSVSTGMTRGDVLTLGVPSSKITMFEDGHLVEIYSYYQNGQKFGGIHLTDGVVSSVQ